MKRLPWTGLWLAAGLVFGCLAVDRALGVANEPGAEQGKEKAQEFLDGLRELGYVPGKTVEIVYRSAEDQADFMDDMARDLLGQKVDVVVENFPAGTLGRYGLDFNMLAALNPKLVYAALTGYGQTEDKQKAKDAGFEQYLVKPVSIVDVELALSKLA